MKVLVATDKPFAKVAVDGIRDIVEGAGFELVLLEGYKEKSELYAAVADVDAIIIRSDKVTREVVEAAKNLKIVVRAGAGYDNVDLEACSERKVVVMNTPGQNSNAVAELVVGFMIFMARTQFTPASGSEISNKSIGVHAYGNIGRIVARYAKSLGMRVYAFDPYVANKSIFAEDGVIEVGSVEELYSIAQYVSLHIPATAQTRGSINFDLLNRMPKNGVLINTARAEVINEADMVRLLTRRTDMKYITDVKPTNAEELKEKFGDRFFATTGKIGAQTSEANINAGLASANQIVDFAKNGVNKFQVNKF